MRIKRVRYKNYCQHKDRTDDIGPGIIGIIGHNGSGKSNWLKGILRALTGKTVNTGKNEDDVSWGESTGEVELHFSVGGEAGKIKRNLKTRSCGMEYESTRYRSAKAIDSAIFKILGVSPRLLQEVVFAQQGEIEAVLFQKPADRKASLMALFGTEKAELIRAMLHDTLTNTPISSRADVINELKAERDKLKTQFDATLAQCGIRRKAVLDPNKVAELQKVIHGAETFAQAREALTEAERKLADFRAQYKDATALMNSKKVALDELNTVTTELHDEVSLTKHKLSNADMLSKAAAARADIEKRMAEAKVFLERPAPEDPSAVDFSELDAKIERLAADRHTLAQWKQFLATFQGQGDTICPTCFQRVDVNATNRIHDEVNNLEPQVEESARVVGMEEAGRRHMQEAYDSYVRGVEEAKRVVSDCEQDLRTIGEGKVFDENEIGEMRALVQVYDDTVAKAADLQQQVAVQTERHKNMFNGMTNASVEVDRLRTKLSTEPKDDVVGKARSALLAHDSARTDVARMEGELNQVSERQKQVVTLLSQREAEEAQLEGLKRYRELCERARTLLHRDNLPNLVAQAYMKSLNAHLEHYLEVFDVPFRARMIEDTSVICKFGSREVPAGRLSGGQRVALGLTWRFAVHALFVNHLGMMILDEPTVYLDKDRIDSVYQLLERVRSYSKAADLQILVSTHEERLAGALDQVIKM
jgi:DNA repair exonuclease SbcCD ATPase subunit